MAEIVKLRQNQQQSRDQIIEMEDRLIKTERKQKQMLTFLAKAFHNPSFIQNLSQISARQKQVKGVDLRRKRRLTMSPSVENLQEAMTATLGSDPVLPFADNEDLVTMESEMETIFSSALYGEASQEIDAPDTGLRQEGLNEPTWEDLLADDLLTANPDEAVLVGAQPEDDCEAEELVPDSTDWGEDLRDLVDQMGYLGPKPLL